MKNHLPLQFVESVWLKHLVLQLFSNTVLHELVENFKETYVLPLLNDYSCVTANFNLWISKGAHDVFVFGHKCFGI